MSAQVLWVVLVLFFVVYLAVSAALFYHWSSYGMRSAGILMAESIFTLVSITLFTVAGLAIQYF